MDKHEGDHAIRRDSLYGTTPEPTYAGVASFMRRKYVTDLEGVDVAVTGVPLDTATTNRPGSRFGPRSIRNASTIMAWEKPYGMAFDPFDKLAVGDVGDCFFDHGRPEKVPDAIEAHASQMDISRGERGVRDMLILLREQVGLRLGVELAESFIVEDPLFGPASILREV